MQNQEAANDLKFIREMIEGAKRQTANSWLFLVGWGFLALLATMLSGIWMHRGAYPLIGLTWFIFMVVGAFASVLMSRLSRRDRSVRTFADKVMFWLWASLGVSLLLFAFILPYAGIYPYARVPLLVSAVVASGLFFSGGIFSWWLLKLAGTIWWIGSLIMVFLPVETYFIVFAILLVIGYLIPGFVLRSYQQESTADADA